MGAPVAVAILGQTRTARKIVIGLLIAFAIAAALVLSPLIVIPLAVGGRGAAASDSEPQAASSVHGTWGYPLDGSYTKGRGFGYNPVVGCNYCSTDHKGYDMAQGCGATIHAAGPGRVITAGAYQGYGNAVRIDHGGGLVTLYGHMRWGSLRVTVGATVSAGTPLGSEGNTGHSFGCHLHFEVQLDGVPIDPQPFMAARGLPLA